jgi:hypothetical protein
VSIRVETPDDGRPHRVTVAGLGAAAAAALSRAAPAEVSSALAVYTGDRVPGPDVPAVIGTHAVDDAGFHFRPRFPFVSGLSYTARFERGEVRLVHTFEVTAAAGREPPRITATYPSGDTLPENTLRLYVQFSRPMTARGVQRHVRLLGPGGAEVPLAFVEVEDGLWDPGQTRLTLFLHPGRVKRGVAPGERLGPPLRAGSDYRLVIDGAVADAAGTPMARPYERRLRAVEADRTSPSGTAVQVQPPTSARGPVAARLPEPLDHALLRRWVWVEDAHGAPVSGQAEVGETETLWTFTPDQPWTAGRHAVRLRVAVEDRAGNRFDRLFDRTAAPGASSADPSETLSFAFDVP